MRDLLSCPFCGGKPVTGSRMDEDLCTHNIVEWKSVSCHECDVSFDIPDGYDGGTAIERWNRRSGLAQGAQESEAERLQHEVDRLRSGYGLVMTGLTEGRVGGEDVVWFDGITTLYDFCGMMLGHLDCQCGINHEPGCHASELSSTEPPKAWLEAKADIDAGWPDASPVPSTMLGGGK